MKWRTANLSAWLTIILALSSCATPRAAEAVPGTAAAAASVVASTAARLDRLRIEITGDVAQLRATERLNYRRVEGGIEDCMHAAEHRYRKVAYVSFYRDFTDADLGVGTGGASVVDSLTAGGRRHMLNEISFARLGRAGVLEPSVPARDVAAFNACSARFDHRQYWDIDPPAGAYDLSAFPGLLTGISRAPRVVAAMRPYRSCMTASGFGVGDDRAEFFAGFVNRADAPVDGRPASAAWIREIAAMKAGSAADATCRRPGHQAAMTMVAPRLSPWQKLHRTELDKIQTAWRQRVTDAAKLPR
jgi:hypothetical protein